jgi:hypothetical protein
VTHPTEVRKVYTDCCTNPVKLLARWMSRMGWHRGYRLHGVLTVKKQINEEIV